jgi:hypothetical protein
MSDRYKFLKSWTDTDSGKTFGAGNVFRTSPGVAAPLIDAGIIMQVADFTICRKDILAPNSCQPVTDEQIEAYTAAPKEPKKVTIKKAT